MDLHVFPILIPPCRLPLYPIRLGLPSAPALSTCLMHPTWAGNLFHPCQSWTMLLWRRIEFHISLRSLPPFLVPVEIFLYKLLIDYWHGCFLDFRSHDDSTLLTFFFLTCNVNLVVFDQSLVLWEVCLKKWTKMWNKVLNCMGETYWTRAPEANFEVSHDSIWLYYAIYKRGWDIKN